MSQPTAPDDNSWDELARELGIDDIAAKIDAVPVEDEPLAEELGEFEEAGIIEAEHGASDSDADDGDDEGEVEGTEDATGDEQPGTGRKRRRRRRRRGRGKGAPGEAEVAGAETTDAPETEAEEPVEVPVKYAAPPRPRMARPEPEADIDSDELETAGIQPAAEEDTGSEVLREMIATWNVPAWDEIVGGLYRPER